ncbi:DUF885 domain-containing protein [Silvibacterium dinghuense]|uniref:DUF885 domain-containing protein n=1 Tax=Silvibacterium dinghuense TaxID=1560006 RepID=A0A4Q1SJD6_9BACT|nr:DUF885 domain-containing protein [Silvibacterium dinghuense]RXS97545.1 DUF885 domain-containing protein [Silvibacterium dinghuense]GGG99895.1 hypothetical protein GCM10011586_14350 [Silvibacterium dinghuense]
MNRRIAPLVLIGGLMTATSLHAQSTADQFRSLASQYFIDVTFHFSPTGGTSAGLHQYDSLLEDYSRAGVDEEVAALHTWEKKFDAVDASKLDESTQGDLAMVKNNIRGTLLELEVIKPWQKNPDTYSSGITGSAFSLMERNFASPDERLKSLVEREKKMPAVFIEAKKNLTNPPKIYTEIALEQLPGLIDFFQHDVPEAFKDAKDQATIDEFHKTNAAVIAALGEYEQWVKTDLLPRSNGDFRIGANAFEKKLEYDEMVDTPLPKLLDIAYADLHKNQAKFQEIAKEVDPNKTPREVLAELATIHPAPDKLLQAFHDRFDSEVGFIRSHHIITIPSDVQPTLEETPPFMRATTQASMDSPGPFEKHSTTAYFNVTLPEKDWTPEHTADYMAAFNVGTIVSTSVHEAFPGHYVQFLWVNHGSLSEVRKLVTSNTNVEGWAHYCEQMMLDEGYGQPGAGATDAREAKLIRLGQLQDALLRDARFIVGIKMHTGQMTQEQAIDFFVKEGYQSRSIGDVETKRGTSDPTYLYYTLGKLQIMKLRADMQKKEGAAFSLQKFHDDFMKQGGAPIKIVRRAMLGDDSPTL